MSDEVGVRNRGGPADENGDREQPPFHTDDLRESERLGSDVVRGRTAFIVTDGTAEGNGFCGWSAH